MKRLWEAMIRTDTKKPIVETISGFNADFMQSIRLFPSAGSSSRMAEAENFLLQYVITYG